MKKVVISVVLAILVLLVPVMRRDSSSVVSAHYEIGSHKIVLTQDNPTFSSGGGLYEDQVKIQSVEFQTRRGGFIRLETMTGNDECFSLRIFRVPDGMSINEAMPHVNNLPCEMTLTGIKGNDLQWLPPGKYIYVLSSKVSYLREWQTEEIMKMREQYRVITTAKTSGA